MAGGERPRWTIYYGDGSTFTDEDGPPEAAPPRDVQAIAQPDNRPEPKNVGLTVLAGWDWWYWRADLGEWWGSDLYGLLDQLMARLPVSAVCQGRHCPNDEYDALLERAHNDPRFPRKSAKAPLERPK